MAYNKVVISGINTSELTVLKEEEKIRLLREIRETGSKEARDKLVKGNLRLVLSVIQRFTGRGEDIDDLGDVLMGNIPVHREKDEIVIYSVGGMPVEDVAWGTIVYRNALKKGIGQKLNLWEEPKLA